MSQGFPGVGGIKMSPCQTLLAMLTEFDKGSESYTIHILDLEKGGCPAFSTHMWRFTCQ